MNTQEKNTPAYHIGLIIGSMMGSFLGSAILYDFNYSLIFHGKHLLMSIIIGFALYGSILMKRQNKR